MPWICSGNVARTVPSTRRASGRGEDLLRRHVRDVLDAVRLVERGAPVGRRDAGRRRGRCRGRGSAARRSGGRSALRRARPSFAMCSRHAATGSGSSRRTAVATALPEPLDVGLAEDRAAPSPRSGRRRSTSCRAPSLSRRLASATSRMRARPTRPPSRSAKSSGSGLPVIESSAPPSAPSSSRRFTSHGGEKPSCIVGRVLDVRPAHVLVGVEHVDESRARRVGLVALRPERAAGARRAR